MKLAKREIDIFFVPQSQHKEFEDLVLETYDSIADFSTGFLKTPLPKVKAFENDEDLHHYFEQICSYMVFGSTPPAFMNDDDEIWFGECKSEHHSYYLHDIHKVLNYYHMAYEDHGEFINFPLVEVW